MRDTTTTRGLDPMDDQQSSPHPPRYSVRYLRALSFFAGAVAHVFLWDILLRRLGIGSLIRRTRPRRFRRLARRFRGLATRLGGVWIKVGQFLSARLDVLPPEITQELAGLQDEVSPEDFSAMRAEIEGSLGDTLEALFADVNPTPLASASLGQVHRARLRDGRRVVVKAQRPRIHTLIETDLAALKRVIGWLKRYRPITRRADLDALYDEFSRTLWEEVDYIAEAKNAARFKAMFADDPGVHVPAVVPERSSERVLTLEDVYFIKITDYAEVEAAGVDRAQVADRLFRTYLRQIFVEGFFHADPHPGNLFVEPREDGWRLVFVDFGMVGRVSATMKHALRDLAIAIGTRDLDRLISSYQQMGVLLPGADLERIREAEAQVFQRLWGRSMRELVEIHPQEMRHFTREFRDLLYEMPFQIPSDLIFLGRCVGILSGMCTGLNPEFNLFEGLRPFAEQLLKEEGEDWLDDLLRLLSEQARALSTLPTSLQATLARIDEGRLVVTAQPNAALQAQIKRLTRSVNRLTSAAVFAALLIAASLLLTGGEKLLGRIGFLLAALSLFWLLIR